MKIPPLPENETQRLSALRAASCARAVCCMHITNLEEVAAAAHYANLDAGDTTARAGVAPGARDFCALVPSEIYMQFPRGGVAWYQPPDAAFEHECGIEASRGELKCALFLAS